jgi:hypothetical protein
MMVVTLKYKGLNKMQSIPKLTFQTQLNDWDVVQEQIDRSKIKRYPYSKYLGKSLTKVIVECLDKGLSSSQAYAEIIRLPEMQHLFYDYYQEKEDVLKNINICISARFSESKRYRG